jgi:hypothetical protein
MSDVVGLAGKPKDPTTVGTAAVDMSLNLIVNLRDSEFDPD